MTLQGNKVYKPEYSLPQFTLRGLRKVWIPTEFCSELRGWLIGASQFNFDPDWLYKTAITL